MSSISSLKMASATTESGWMTKAMFGKWTTAIFIPFVQSRRTAPDQRALLVLDGHSSRMSYPTALLLKEAAIDVAVLPAHSSRITQPFDLAVFSPFKEHLRQACSRFENYFQTVLDIHDALQKALTFRNIRAGFRRAGIWLLNLQRVFDHQAMPATEETASHKPKRGFSLSGIILTGPVGIAVLEDLEQRRHSAPSSTQPDTPSVIPVDSGSPRLTPPTGPRRHVRRENRINTDGRIKVNEVCYEKASAQSGESGSYRCSICQGQGHNSRTCLRNRQEEEEKHDEL